MNLQDEINKCITNLTNSVKALKIATQELNNAADAMELSSKKPKLEIVKNELEKPLTDGMLEGHDD